MVHLETRAEGVILPVKAQPGAKRSTVTGCQAGMLKVAVTQVAERGKANRAIIAVLSKSLCLRKSQLQLIAGETSRQKRFLVRDVSEKELAAKIAELLQ